MPLINELYQKSPSPARAALDVSLHINRLYLIDADPLTPGQLLSHHIQAHALLHYELMIPISHVSQHLHIVPALCKIGFHHSS
jgi:hypothetical protein